MRSYADFAMTVPNSDRVIIAADKLTGYLLNVSHKRGGPKAKATAECRISFGERASTGVGLPRSAPFARCEPHA